MSFNVSFCNRLNFAAVDWNNLAIYLLCICFSLVCMNNAVVEKEAIYLREATV